MPTLFDMKRNLRGLRKAGIAVVAVVLALGVSALPRFEGQAAAAQVTSRSIMLSNSASGATSVSYQIGFTAPSNATIKGIVVDFCDNDPIIGDSTCTLPTGFSIGASPTVATSGGSNTGLTGTWTAASANTNRTLELTNATGTALNNTAVIFTLSGVTNPSTANHSFYARILTYTTTTGATGYAPGTEGSFTDYGGVAMSTGNTITITAKVMETLSFCVYHTSCGDSPAISLGHGTNTILDSTGIDTASDKFSISTNAQSGVSVRWQGATLTSGSNTIPAVGPASPSSSPATITAGTAAFGAALPSGTLGAGITAITAYGGNGTSTFGLVSANVTSTYGDTIATSTGPLNASVTTITFGATASNTTPAGIYTANEQLIATGTF